MACTSRESITCINGTLSMLECMMMEGVELLTALRSFRASSSIAIMRSVMRVRRVQHGALSLTAHAERLGRRRQLLELPPSPLAQPSPPWSDSHS